MSARHSLGFLHRWEPGTDPAAPTLLLLHGTGGDENDLLPLGHALAPGAALLSPRGQVLENGMPRFFRRLAQGVFDQEDLARRTDELTAFVQAAADSYGFDPHGLVALGFSNGANIAASVLLRHPGVLPAAILLSPMVPFDPELPVALQGTRIFIGAGTADRIAPPAQAERLAALLRQSGADVTLHWHPGGHGLIPGELQAARGWLVENIRFG